MNEEVTERLRGQVGEFLLWHCAESEVAKFWGRKTIYLEYIILFAALGALLCAGEQRADRCFFLCSCAQIIGHAELVRDDGYEGQHDCVRRLIEQARVELVNDAGSLGPWESGELDYAEMAVASGFLNLALVAINKAIIVNSLPANEYEQGFNYGKRQ